MQLFQAWILSFLFLASSPSPSPSPAPTPTPTQSPSPSPSQSTSPSPSPSPSPTITFLTNGLTSSPPCQSELIGCLRHHHGYSHEAGGPPHLKHGDGNGGLNFGIKIGIVFAVVAVLLQFVIVGFLFYKRKQIKMYDFRSVTNSDS